MRNLDTAPLLIEIGTEELPPKSLDTLVDGFARGVVDGLAGVGIGRPVSAADVVAAISGATLHGNPEASFGHETLPYRKFCSPRRLAVLIPDVPLQQPPQRSEVLGPFVNVGLDANGEPTAALRGFAAKNGIAIDALQRVPDTRGERFVARSERPGQPTATLIPGIVADAVKALPIPKPMRWGGHDHAFVRPVHWLVALHGADVVDVELLGLHAGRHSRGHRFHHPQPVHIADADSWLDALRGAQVLADPGERRERVRAEVERAGQETGGTPRLSEVLLDEIANLTEWPVAIACAFEDAFLGVPPEALVMTMETNQKFVPVFDAQGRLAARFIGVANIASKDPAEIRKGYERVIRPRFADAKFFYDEDRKQPLSAYQDALKSVTYQQSLGNVWEKCVRVAEMARVIANRVGVDAGLATRAAALSKCDLMTRMVGEFPELQGVMGRSYAAQGDTPEHPEVANALDAFYRPRFAGDAIADGKVGQVLAVAERLDTLCGIFAVGQKPGGNKDPFALRRAALGLARTLIEAPLDIDLRAHFHEALALLPEAALAAGLPKGKDGKAATLDAGARRAQLEAELYEFILDRLRGYYADQGIAGEAFEAVRALAPSSLVDFDRRLRAVVAFAALPEAQALAAANKRIGNILRQAGGSISGDIVADLLESEAERALVEAVATTEADSAPLIAAGDHVGVLCRLAALREPVDRFFDTVMVMADDPATRRNRLIVLSRLRALFLRVADVSLLPSTAA